jgi:hypothetical protein
MQNHRIYINNIRCNNNGKQFPRNNVRHTTNKSNVYEVSHFERYLRAAHSVERAVVFLPSAFNFQLSSSCFRLSALRFSLSALGLQLSPSPVYVLQPYCNTINYVLQILLAAIDGACFI